MSPHAVRRILIFTIPSLRIKWLDGISEESVLKLTIRTPAGTPTP